MIGVRWFWISSVVFFAKCVGYYSFSSKLEQRIISSCNWSRRCLVESLDIALGCSVVWKCWDCWLCQARAYLQTIVPSFCRVFWSTLQGASLHRKQALNSSAALFLYTALPCQWTCRHFHKLFPSCWNFKQHQLLFAIIGDLG